MACFLLWIILWNQFTSMLLKSLYNSLRGWAESNGAFSKIVHASYLPQESQWPVLDYQHGLNRPPWGQSPGIGVDSPILRAIQAMRTINSESRCREKNKIDSPIFLLREGISTLIAKSQNNTSIPSNTTSCLDSARTGITTFFENINAKEIDIAMQICRHSCLQCHDFGSIPDRDGCHRTGLDRSHSTAYLRGGGPYWSQ